MGNYARMQKSEFGFTLGHPFDDKEKPKTQITLLLVSDIHNAIKRLEKLKNWHVDINRDQIHYVLVLGDTDNLNNNDPSSQSLIEGVVEATISNILTFLEFFSVPIIYLPGNHDATSLFSDQPPQLTQYSTNLHQKNLVIGDGLQLLGLGGSLPGYIFDTEGKKTELWKAYPYDEVNFEADMMPMLQKYTSPDLETLLLTHNGPWFSGTTLDTTFDVNSPVYAGCEYLSKVLKDPSWRIVANFHGHTHAGVGRTNIGAKGLQVINPGSLMDGNFAIVKLIRTEVDKKWIIKSTEFINLNGFP